MNGQRMDDLAEEALATGAVPAGVTAEERTELEALLASAGALRLDAATVAREARESMPTARARFERYIAAEQAAAAAPAVRVPQRPRRGFPGGILAPGRKMAFAGSAAAVGLIVLVAVFASQSWGGVETASALTIDDYVQVRGVVSGVTEEGGERRLSVQSSEFGTLNVAVSELTSVVDDQTSVDPAALRAGDSVLVGGVVVMPRKAGEDARIAAKTLAVGAEQVPPPPRARLKELREFREGVQGSVAALTVSPDGKSAQVLIDIGNGERHIVRVDPGFVGDLVQRGIGARVAVERIAGGPSGVFAVVPAGDQPPGDAPGGPRGPGGRPDAGRSPAKPSFVGVRGVITGRTQNVLQVETDRGSIEVVVRQHTRVLLQDSGLTREAFAAGETIVGHRVAITGGLERPTKRVVADVLLLGPK